MTTGREPLAREDRDALQSDLLASLCAHVAEQRAEWAGAADERFLEWLAREHEADAEPRDLWTPDEAAAVACAIEARMRAAAAPVRRIDRAPALRPASPPGPAARGVAAAAGARCAPFLDLAAAAGSGRELWDELCEQWVVLPSDAPRGRHVALRVAGDSMAPLLHPGDVVLVRLGGEAKPGAVIVARLPDGGYVVKQVEAAGERLVLRSLNPGFEPIAMPHEPRAVLGTVVMRWCAHR